MHMQLLWKPQPTISRSFRKPLACRGAFQWTLMVTRSAADDSPCVLCLMKLEVRVSRVGHLGQRSIKEQDKMAFKSEYKVGHMVINLRILMEPKGFLRIIMMVSRWKGGIEAVVWGGKIWKLCMSAPEVQGPSRAWIINELHRLPQRKLLSHLLFRMYFGQY